MLREFFIKTPKTEDRRRKFFKSSSVFRLRSSVLFKRISLRLGLLATIVVSLLFSSNLIAQTIQARKFSFGLRAGLNVAQIFGSGSQAFNHFGFSGGVKLGYKFANRWSFDPELLYNMKGAARYPDVEKGDYYSFSLDLDYIEVPIMFNYHFGKKKNFSIEFGPSIGFTVRQKAYENGLAINSTTANFNIYDISLAVGLNYTLPKGFGLNFRYMNSIVPIQPTFGSLQWGTTNFNIGQLNSVLNLSVWYKFDFRPREEKLLDGTIKEKPVKEKVVKNKKQKGDIIDEDE